jgi:SM-20-related protein
MRGRLPPYLVRQNFLGADLSARLLAHAIDTEAGFQPSKVVDHGASRVDPSFRVSVIQRELGALKREVREAMHAAAPELIKSLRVTPFDVMKVEVEMAAHGDGAFYRRHTDTFAHDPAGASDRLVSGVYYFHQMPKQYSGGALRLYAFGSGSDLYEDIVAAHDSLVVFPSWAAHEVLPVSCPSGRFADSRFALNCWFLRARVP